MKSVLISIQPKWVNKIASGEKTIEVRKTRPKLKTPFKCYIYCTNSNGTLFMAYDGLHYGENYVGRFDPACVNGKVIGEFVCDRIDKYLCKEYEWEDGQISLEYRIKTIEGEKTCLEYDEIKEYGNEKPLYFWHISNLKIYDKLKELSDFSAYAIKYKLINNSYRNKYRKVLINPLKRPFQSWGYILGE